MPGPAGTTGCSFQDVRQILRHHTGPKGDHDGHVRKEVSMEAIVERCAALDIHKDTTTAAVRLPGERGAA